MKNKTIMGVPKTCFYVVIVTCVVGIIVGSIYDFSINVALANKTEIGSFFATYGSYFSYCLYPAAGTCLYVGLNKKDNRFKLLAKVLLVVSIFMAVYYSNNYNGKVVRQTLGYVANEASPILSVLSWLFWLALYIWIPLLMKKI